MSEAKSLIDLSVIIPSYLEAEALRILLPQLMAELRALHCTFEVLIIDTEAPMDTTAEVCRDHHVTYFNRKGGNFYGDAVRTGIARSRGRRILFMDADGSHSPKFISKLYAHKDDADLVVASRYVQGGSTENSWVLILMSRIVNIGYAWVLNIPCKDVSNSFKLYNGEMLRSLKLTFHNFDIIEEILYKLILRNSELKIIEIPFSFEQRKAGHTKRNLIAFIFSYAISLLKLRLLDTRLSRLFRPDADPTPQKNV